MRAAYNIQADMKLCPCYGPLALYIIHDQLLLISRAQEKGDHNICNLSHVAPSFVVVRGFGVWQMAKRPESHAARGRPGNVWRHNIIDHDQ